MGGGLVMTKLGEASPRRFTNEAFVRENLPYIMGTISLLVIILATAVSSATAAGTFTIETSTSGSAMGHSSFSWSGMPVAGLGGAAYYSSGFPLQLQLLAGGADRSRRSLDSQHQMEHPILPGPLLELVQSTSHSERPLPGFDVSRGCWF
jgi:hypothetical protein